jgi:type IV pilus assembly protein PilM
VFLFTRRKTPLVGIDISSTSVKLLELSKAGSRYRVEHYAVEPLPPNAISEKTISDVDAVGETIQKALKRSGSKAKSCCMAVASSAVITKKITMPATLNDDDLEGQVQLEADQYIPYAMEEVNLDFEVLGPTEGAPESVDVLLAASRSENVEMRTAAADFAGLTSKVVDVEAYAVENAFSLLADQLPEEIRDKTIGVIDIGATMTSLNLITDKKMVYTREQPFGGKQLTEAIMNHYGLSYAEAGLAKKVGDLPENYVPELLEPFKETIVQQVNRLLQFFYSTSQYNSVDHIIMGGGCAAIPGVDELIQGRLRIPATIANPFGNASLSSRINPQHLSNDAPTLLIACGLALRSFD